MREIDRETVGRFRLVRRLGSGGQGAVYLAHDPALGRSVALKLLSGGSPSEGVEEARSAAAFHHPNAAAVYEAGEDGGLAYVALELVEGPSIRDALKRGPLEPATVFTALRDVALALAAAHARGLAHGDVSPANVVLLPGGGAKLVDFGLAHGRSAPGSPQGTVRMLAPELLRGGAPTPASDVFALGATLQAALTGRPAFPGDTVAAVRDAILRGAPAPIDGRGRRTALVELVARMLEADPARRPLASEVAESLERLACAPLVAPVSGVHAAAVPGFRGLLPFREEDGEALKGRDADVDALVSRVSASGSVVVLYGDSGCGKTSLLRAGLAVRLRAEGALVLYARASGDPSGRLAESAGRWVATPRREGEELIAYLARVGRSEGRVVVFLDQLEELLRASDDERRRVAGLLAAIARTECGVSAVVAVRSDVLHLLPDLLGGAVEEPLAMSRLHRLRPFDPDVAAHVLAAGLDASGLTFEPGLAALVAAELAEGGAVLPSELQVVGQELVTRRLLTARQLDAAGGTRALTLRFLEDVLSAAEDPAAARRVLEALVSERGERAALPLADVASRAHVVPALAERTLRRLGEARLVRERYDLASPVWELVHEYVVTRLEVLGKVADDPALRAHRLVAHVAAAAAAEPHTRLSLRQVLFIRRHAGRLDPLEAALVTRSLVEGVRRALAILAIALLAGTAFAASLSIREEWAGQLLSDRHQAAARQVRFSPDGRRLYTAGEDGRLLLWDVATRRRLATRSVGESWVTALAVSRDGRLLASAGESGAVTLWDAATLESVRVLDGPAGVTGLGFSRDGGFLAAQGVLRSRVFSTNDGDVLADLDVRASHGAVLFSADGRDLVLANGLRLDWRRAVLHEAEGLPRGSNAMDLSADGRRLVSVDPKGRVDLAFRQGDRVETVTRRAHRDHGRAAVLSPSGRLAATGAEGIALWDTSTCQVVARFDQEAVVWDLAFSPDERSLVAAYGDGSVLAWDVVDRSLAGGFGAHTGPVRSVAFSSDGRLLASGSEDRSVLVWDVATGRIVRSLPGLPTRVNAVAFGPGDLLFAGDQDGGVRAWHHTTGALAWTRDATDSVYAFSVSPDGSRLATSPVELASEDGRPLRVRPSGPLGTAGTISGSAYGVAYDADGSLLLADQRGSFVLLGNGAARSGRLQGRSLVTAAFIPGTRNFALGTNEGEVLLLSGETLSEIGVLGRHRARVKAVAASPDGKWLVSCGDDRELWLWDLAARRRIGPIGTHPAPVLAVAFSPDGRRVASGGHDGSVRLHAGRRLLWGRELP